MSLRLSTSRSARCQPDFREFPDAMARPILATETVRLVGEPVAIVLTEQHLQGEDAAEAVDVEYEALPALVDPASAEAAEVVLFPDHGSNVVVDSREPLPEGFFDGCDVVVRQRIRNQRLAPCPLEVRSTAAAWFEGRLTQFVSTQVPHRTRDWLAQTFGLPASQVRVVAPDVGGGFGAKTFYPEDVAIAWAARETGRPVRWTETRSESMLSLNHWASPDPGRCHRWARATGRSSRTGWTSSRTPVRTLHMGRSCRPTPAAWHPVRMQSRECRRRPCPW